MQGSVPLHALLATPLAALLAAGKSCSSKSPIGWGRKPAGHAWVGHCPARVQSNLLTPSAWVPRRRRAPFLNRGLAFQSSLWQVRAWLPASLPASLPPRLSANLLCPVAVPVPQSSHRPCAVHSVPVPAQTSAAPVLAAPPAGAGHTSSPAEAGRAQAALSASRALRLPALLPSRRASARGGACSAPCSPTVAPSLPTRRLPAAPCCAQVHRQRDRRFVDILHALREGRHTQAQLAELG